MPSSFRQPGPWPSTRLLTRQLLLAISGFASATESSAAPLRQQALVPTTWVPGP